MADHPQIPFLNSWINSDYCKIILSYLQVKSSDKLKTVFSVIIKFMEQTKVEFLIACLFFIFI